MPLPSHLKRSDDLVTSQGATRAGFLALAIERNRLSTPLVAQGQAFKTEASHAGTIEQCVANGDLRPAILTAAGVSDKAKGHFTDIEKDAAIKDLVDKYMTPAGVGFVDQLVFRFLLTKGDSIGGTMRNVGGQLAQRKLIRSLAAAMDIANLRYHWLDRDRVWHLANANEPDFEFSAQGLNWRWQGKNRTLLFNRRVPSVGTNVDLCLLNCQRSRWEAALRSPSAFVALGELKGGVDPAGADEHWKTARAALNRIESAFSNSVAYPALFFIGAAIVRNMAAEIFERLEKNTLANAANLTDDAQLAAIAQWIRRL